MSDIRTTEGSLTGAGRRFGIVASRFTWRTTDLLVAGAVDCLRRRGTCMPRDEMQHEVVPGHRRARGDELLTRTGRD